MTRSRITPRSSGRLRPVAAALLLGALSGCSAEEEAERFEVRPLPSPAAVGSGEASLSTGADGRVHLSWLEPEGEGAHALRFAVLEGDAWSAARTVATGSDWFVNWADFPSLIPLGDGRLAAHWLQRNGPGTYAYDVRVSLSEDGGESWGPATTPHTDGTETEHGFVSMWPAGEGGVALVWLDGRNLAGGGNGHDAAHEMTLRYTTVGADGRAAPDVEIDPRVCDCCQTGAAVTSVGPVVVYRGRTAGEVRDIHVTRRVGGRWTEGRPVHEDGWVIPACPVNGPQVDAAGSRVAVAWYTAADDDARVLAAFSEDAGATFAPPVRLDDGAPLGRVDILLLDDGDAVVTWLERDATGGAELRLRRLSPDGTPGTSHRVAGSDAARSSGFPRMTRAGEGVVLAWTAAEPERRVKTARVTLARGGGR